jgi:hypothetical protein
MGPTSPVLAGWKIDEQYYKDMTGERIEYFERNPGRLYAQTQRKSEIQRIVNPIHIQSSANGCATQRPLRGNPNPCSIYYMDLGGE